MDKFEIMSVAASLFTSDDKNAETLHRRITPSDEQFENQKMRWNHLADFLCQRLRDDSGYAMRTWLQGSYKFHTQIRPWDLGAEFDIDLGLYFQWEGEPTDADEIPQELKGYTQSALLDYLADDENDATEVCDPKERCCRIRFEPDFHIDVPCYHLDPKQDQRSLATENNGWENSDPKAIYEWFKNVRKDPKDRAQLRRIVRYLKMWAALRIAEKQRPSSILLTVLAAEALEGVEAKQNYEDDDLLENLAAIIVARLEKDTVVANPIAKEENINRLRDEDTIALIDSLRILTNTGLPH